MIRILPKSYMKEVDRLNRMGRVIGGNSIGLDDEEREKERETSSTAGESASKTAFENPSK